MGYRIGQVLIKFHTMICNLMSYINIPHARIREQWPMMLTYESEYSTVPVGLSKMPNFPSSRVLYRCFMKSC